MKSFSDFRGGGDIEFVFETKEITLKLGNIFKCTPYISAYCIIFNLLHICETGAQFIICEAEISIGLIVFCYRWFKTLPVQVLKDSLSNTFNRSMN